MDERDEVCETVLVALVDLVVDNVSLADEPVLVEENVSLCEVETDALENEHVCVEVLLQDIDCECDAVLKEKVIEDVVECVKLCENDVDV